MKFYQWFATGLWFSPGTLAFSTNKTDSHDITEILLKVALNTINQTYVIFFFFITDVDVNMLEEEEDVPEVTCNKRQKVKK
jgi:hypothetical protein